MTKTYSEMTLDELQKEKEYWEEVIRCNEISNDFYYSSQDQKYHSYQLFLVNREIKSRTQSVSELTTELMKGFTGC